MSTAWSITGSSGRSTSTIPTTFRWRISWDCVDLLRHPAIVDDDPIDVAAEGSTAQPGVWPQPSEPATLAALSIKPGNGHAMRDAFVSEGKAVAKPELAKILEDFGRGLPRHPAEPGKVDEDLERGG